MNRKIMLGELMLSANKERTESLPQLSGAEPKNQKRLTPILPSLVSQSENSTFPIALEKMRLEYQNQCLREKNRVAFVGPETEERALESANVEVNQTQLNRSRRQLTQNASRAATLTTLGVMSLAVNPLAIWSGIQATIMFGSALYFGYSARGLHHSFNEKPQKEV